jgi:hypothetical protein
MHDTTRAHVDDLYPRHGTQFSPDTMSFFMAYPWFSSRTGSRVPVQQPLCLLSHLRRCVLHPHPRCHQGQCDWGSFHRSRCEAFPIVSFKQRRFHCSVSVGDARMEAISKFLACCADVWRHGLNSVRY